MEKDELPCLNCIFEYWCNWNKVDEDNNCKDFKSVAGEDE